MSHLFKKGVSGNPKGRPKGAISKRTAALKAVEKQCGSQEQFFNEVLKRALDDNHPNQGTFAKIIADRVAPPLKSRDLTIEIEDFPTELNAQIDKIFELICNGTINTSEAQKMTQLLALKQDNVLAERLELLQDQIDNKHLKVVNHA